MQVTVCSKQQLLMYYYLQQSSSAANEDTIGDTTDTIAQPKKWLGLGPDRRKAGISPTTGAQGAAPTSILETRSSRQGAS